MRWVVELSGEHPSLPEAELRALTGDRLERDGRAALVEAPADAPLGRLALAHVVGEHLGSADDLEDLAAQAAGWDRVGAPFAVRATVQDGDWDRERILERLGDVLGKTRKVDLEAPADVVRVAAGDRLHAHCVVHRIDRSAMEARRSTKRPFFMPTSLHPRIARALVNLSGARKGLLDPFLGTGGILLEAGLMGIRGVGVELDPSVARGAVRNLDHYDVPARVLVGDVRSLPCRDGFDAVVTDPPYGRSTRTDDATPGELVDALLDAAGELLSAGQRLVVVVPEPLEPAAGWDPVGTHAVRVHRSMTRHVTVLERA